MWKTKTLIDCADAQADSSLRWRHMAEGEISRVAGHLIVSDCNCPNAIILGG